MTLDGRNTRRISREEQYHVGAALMAANAGLDSQVTPRPRRLSR